jgi:hypothetical protein
MPLPPAALIELRSYVVAAEAGTSMSTAIIQSQSKFIPGTGHLVQSSTISRLPLLRQVAAQHCAINILASPAKHGLAGWQWVFFSTETLLTRKNANDCQL